MSVAPAGSDRGGAWPGVGRPAEVPAARPHLGAGTQRGAEFPFEDRSECGRGLWAAGLGSRGLLSAADAPRAAWYLVFPAASCRR